MPTELFAAPAVTTDLGVAHVGARASACGCPLCSGQAMVTDPPVLVQPGAYQNADVRSGASPNGKTNLTIDEAGMKLIGYAPGWSSALGVGFTVTYGFRASAPTTMPSDSQGFSVFSANQIRQAELALTAWSDVADIRFVRVAPGDYTDEATILFANYSSGQSGASAFAYNPGRYPGALDGADRAGDVWINSTYNSNINPVTGNFGGHVLVHEIGHAIGLDHPSEYNAGTGQTFTYAANASYYEDSRQFTVMSYFGEWNTNAEYRGSYAAAPQLDDIAAAQFEYGVNPNTRADDTVYGFGSTADRPWFLAGSAASRLIFAVWDAGGTDTFNFQGYAQNQMIDLREGHFSDVGGLLGNVAIAKGVVIENVNSGGGADLIIGNAAANTITAGAGVDTVYGGPGDDLIDGGSGSSYLRGEDGDDVIIGGSAFDDLHGNKGQDTLRGGGAADWVVGGQGDDLLYGDDGDDVIYGNLGADWGEGGAGADLMRGGQGNDIIKGGDGNDWLFGDRGDDILFGGPGADTFGSFAEAGLDIVADFSQAEGDRVRLDAGTGYNTYQSGEDTIVDMGGGNLVILQNIQITSLQPGWLIVG